MKRFLAFCVVLMLAACAPRGAFQLVPAQLVSADVIVQPVYVATNRYPLPEPENALFNQRLGHVRDPQLRFARVDISIPPGHVLGQIEWPSNGNADPARHFVTQGEAVFADAPEFLAQLNGSDVVLFVHGYNVNNAEAIYRLAQIAHDFEAKGPVIAFSWPSAGKAGGYVHDRDSVIFSRDALESLLSGLTVDGKRVLIVGHSMGSQLVMETLRQLSISGKSHVLKGLSGVALISPDIDNDVFVQQARRIAPFPEPFLLITSSHDRILNLSAWLSDSPKRLGSIRDTDGLGGLPVQVVDISDAEGGDPTGHSTAFTSPAAIKLLQGLGTDG